MVEDNMKKKIISAVVAIVLVVAVAGILVPTIKNKIGKGNVITSSQLEKAIDISELSTAEFVYNGVAEKRDDEKPEEVACYISYDSNVKVGIKLEDVRFKIDDEKKTIQPILPEITVNVAVLNEESISYIPKNPDLSLKEVISLCKEDAMKEANSSDGLHKTAEENLRAVIEALLTPILDSSGYSIVW